MRLRIGVALFTAAHGIGFVLWFLITWLPSTLGGATRSLSFTDAPATGFLGKSFGILALLVLAGFLISARGIWRQTSWWPETLGATAAVAIPTAWSVWNPVGDVSSMAELANVALLVVALLSSGRRFLAAN